jgi:FMN phosphatase YigB (HAD superfamily)
MRKPSDAIYEHVEWIAEVAPHYIVFFDDLAENITAATRRGWRAHQISNRDDPLQQVRALLRGHGVL